MRSKGLTRRAFLERVGQMGAALMLSGGILSNKTIAQVTEKPPEQPLFPGKEKMIVLSSRPIVLEMPPEGFEDFITRTDMFFVRNNIGMPEIDVNVWNLTIDGEVKNPLRLSMADIKKFKAVEAVITLECFGNGRSFFEPKPAGNQWKKGGIGTAVWKGIRLKDVLEKAGLTDKSRHVIFDGADEPFTPAAPDFRRSIPIEKAMSPETLLVYEMNGEPLPVYHGYPLRVLVPGWGGSASVKWLINITVSEKEFEGFYMVDKYRHPKNPVAPGTKVQPKDMFVLTELDVKSIITSPSDNARVSGEEISIKGYAWTGEAKIKKVEISTDLGKIWQEAKIIKDGGKFVWSLWEYKWRPKQRGYYVLMSKATDTNGRTQPLYQYWNQDGYLYNVIDKVGVHVE
ncbi:MAG: sulfite oxidase [Thermodesulfovibrionales bacterium]|nr:sulfite oxidase [Thermodesulfovibrionales bacterium]